MFCLTFFLNKKSRTKLKKRHKRKDTFSMKIFFPQQMLYFCSSCYAQCKFVHKMLSKLFLIRISTDLKKIRTDRNFMDRKLQVLFSLKIEWVKNIENCLNWGSFCTFSEDETLIMSGLRALDYEVNIRIYYSLIAWQLPNKIS